MAGHSFSHACLSDLAYSKEPQWLFPALPVPPPGICELAAAFPSKCVYVPAPTPRQGLELPEVGKKGPYNFLAQQQKTK